MPRSLEHHRVRDRQVIAAGAHPLEHLLEPDRLRHQRQHNLPGQLGPGIELPRGRLIQAERLAIELLLISSPGRVARDQQVLDPRDGRGGLESGIVQRLRGEARHRDIAAALSKPLQHQVVARCLHKHRSHAHPGRELPQQPRLIEPTEPMHRSLQEPGPHDDPQIAAFAHRLQITDPALGRAAAHRSTEKHQHRCSREHGHSHKPRRLGHTSSTNHLPNVPLPRADDNHAGLPDPPLPRRRTPCGSL